MTRQQTTDLIKKNKNSIVTVIIAILTAILGTMGFDKYYLSGPNDRDIALLKWKIELQEKEKIRISQQIESIIIKIDRMGDRMDDKIDNKFSELTRILINRGP